MLDCESVIKVVYEYLDSDLDPSRLRGFEIHIGLCHSCFTRVEFERLLRVRMQVTTGHECPDKVRKRIEDILGQI